MLIRIQKLAVIILVIAMVTSAVALATKYERQYRANQATFQRELKIEQDKQKRESQEQDKLQEERIEQQKKDLEQQIEALKQQSAAKKAQTLAAAAKAAQSVATQAVAHAQASSISGTKADWMRAAGIPESQWSYVDYIVSRESGWNPAAVNKSSGACSLMQSLPCSKIGADWSNPVTALKWGDAYVKARYGGWSGAVAFWQSHNWY